MNWNAPSSHQPRINSNSINLKNHKMKEEGRGKLNIFWQTILKVERARNCRKKIFGNENFQIEMKTMTLALLTPSFSTMSFRSNYSTSWEMRWLYCNVKISTRLKSFTYCHKEEHIKFREKAKICRRCRLNLVSYLPMRFEINARARSIFREKHLLHTKKIVILW